MRILLDLPAPMLEALSTASKERGAPRAAVVREAIAEYLDRRRKAVGHEAFGIWKDGPDGLTMQQALRGEW
ncbi:MAG: ribbon-helix-helix protein, CopG family [Beijerinckiaceae bacterium]